MKRFKRYIEERKLVSGLSALALSGAAMGLPHTHPQETQTQQVATEPAPFQFKNSNIERIYGALVNAEHRGFVGEDPYAHDPKHYVRTRIPGKHSAYGPVQINVGTAEDALGKRGGMKWNTSHLTDYERSFLAQGAAFQNNKDPKHKTFGVGGIGNLSGAEHHDNYKGLAQKVIERKAQIAGVKIPDQGDLSPSDLNKLVSAFRGDDPEGVYTNIVHDFYYGKNKNKESAPTPTPTPEDTPTPNDSEYLIGSGENLTRIAKKHGMSIQDIMKLNPHIKDPDSIRAGDKLKIK